MGAVLPSLKKMKRDPFFCFSTDRFFPYCFFFFLAKYDRFFRTRKKKESPLLPTMDKPDFPPKTFQDSEVVYLILSQPELDVRDRLALTSTCRVFYKAAKGDLGSSIWQILDLTTISKHVTNASLQDLVARANGQVKELRLPGCKVEARLFSSISSLPSLSLRLAQRGWAQGEGSLHC